MPVRRWGWQGQSAFAPGDLLPAGAVHLADGRRGRALAHHHDEGDDEHHDARAHEQVTDHHPVDAGNLELQCECDDRADDEEKNSASDTHFSVSSHLRW